MESGACPINRAHGVRVGSVWGARGVRVGSDRITLAQLNHSDTSDADNNRLRVSAVARTLDPWQMLESS
jgi:hypothetical protein